VDFEKLNASDEEWCYIEQYLCCLLDSVSFSSRCKCAKGTIW